MWCLRESLFRRWRFLLTMFLVFRGGASLELQIRSTCAYYDMYRADCHGLELTAVPRNLKTTIELFDFSENRMREVKVDSFDCYPNIKYLHLQKNQIISIEEGAFAPLVYVKILKLSENALVSLPNSIFQLPSLEELFLSGNNLIGWDWNLLMLQKPIKAPLRILDISHCGLEALPDLGPLPALIQYNVSDNPLVKMYPETFASMCRLELTVLSRSLDYVDVCDLRSIAFLFKRRNTKYIAGTLLPVTHKGECLDPDFGRLDRLHEECSDLAVPAASERRGNSEVRLIIALVTLAGFLVGFILMLYVLHRCDVARMKRREENGEIEREADSGVELQELDWKTPIYYN